MTNIAKNDDLDIQHCHAKAFVRPMRRCATRTQLRQIQAYWPDAKLYMADASTDERDMRERWLRDLVPTDIAVIARLDVLPVFTRPGKHGPRPGADYAATLARLYDRSLYVFEAATGVTSRDASQWYERVAHGADRVAAGRAMSSEQAKKRVRRRWDAAQPNRVDHWNSPAMQAQLDYLRAHWNNHNSARDAWESLPDSYRESIGSLTSARRILNATATTQP